MAIGPIIVVEGTKAAIDVISALKEYSIERERQITERERVRATLEVCLKELELKAEAVRRALEIQHDERKILYGMLQESLSRAAERGDVNTFESITKVLLVIYDRGPQLEKLGLSITEAKKLSHEK